MAEDHIEFWERHILRNSDEYEIQILRADGEWEPVGRGSFVDITPEMVSAKLRRYRIIESNPCMLSSGEAP